MTVPDAKRLKDLELENSRLKKLLAESLLDIGALKVVTRGKGEPGSGAGGGRRCRRKPTSPSVVPVSCSGCPALCCATSRELVCKTPSCKPNWWNWPKGFGTLAITACTFCCGVLVCRSTTSGFTGYTEPPA